MVLLVMQIVWKVNLVTILMKIILLNLKLEEIEL